MSTLPAISFENITFGFGTEPVLENVSFEAPAGAHTVIKGDSGSGKSTILKILLGFLAPSSGNISIDHAPVSIHKIRKQTAWLPQDLQLGDDPVRKILAKPFQFSANNHKAFSNEQAQSALTELRLAPDILTKQYRNLSTGQRQRVGIALCVLLDKPILLLDEPTSALDKRSKECVFNFLIAHTNKTIISTSHDPFWVNRADTIIELD